MLFDSKNSLTESKFHTVACFDSTYETRCNPCPLFYTN